MREQDHGSGHGVKSYQVMAGHGVKSLILTNQCWEQKIKIDDPVKKLKNGKIETNNFNMYNCQD